MTKELLTVEDFLERYSIGRTTFYREVAAGRLRLRKMGSASRVAREDAEAWGLQLGNDVFLASFDRFVFFAGTAHERQSQCNGNRRPHGVRPKSSSKRMAVFCLTSIVPAHGFIAEHRLESSTCTGLPPTILPSRHSYMRSQTAQRFDGGAELAGPSYRSLPHLSAGKPHFRRLLLKLMALTF